MEVGGWVQVSWEKNDYTMCILFVLYCTLMIVVSYYDLSFLSMPVMGFSKKSLDGRWVAGVSSIQYYLDYRNLFNFAETLSKASYYEYVSPNGRETKKGTLSGWRGWATYPSLPVAWSGCLLPRLREVRADQRIGPGKAGDSCGEQRR